MPTRTKLWEPAPERADGSQMQEFLRRIVDRFGIEPHWEALRTWSIDRREHFWPELLEFAGVEPSAPARSVVSSDDMLAARWFEGMTLNYSRHLLRYDDDRDAILFENEVGTTKRLSHRVLRDEAARCARALANDGVKRGDRVAAYMPNMPETIVAMLAATSRGAVWSSCSPDFGVSGVLDRFGQIDPTVLVVADGYCYGGKRIETLRHVRAILEQLPSVRRVIVVPHLDEQPDCADLGNAVLWRDYLGAADHPAPDLTFTEVPFEHPLFILYSSGTTGVPKCIVHGHGGTLLQHMKELMLHCDLRPDERIFYFTTCGWMMWNWLISSLGVGAAVVLYDGNPGHPDLHRLWQLAERQRVHVFGTSPKFIHACQKSHLRPGSEHDLSALRCLLSTGAPLSAEQFTWVYDEVRRDLQLSSISGGTDLISCFMLGNPILPVYAGEIQCRGLGMDVHAWNDAGRPVTGEKGELVCTAPFPSQPVEFWNDPGQSKYQAAYFEHFTKDGSRHAAPVWRHGDFIEISATGGVVVYGRSDATLNPGGVRIGTAEIYRIVEALPEVLDSIVVGRQKDDDVDICLFVVLRPPAKLTAELTRRIRSCIAAGATKRHVPRHIRAVPAIPHTLSGKKVELAVYQILHGRDVQNRAALANPEALDAFRIIL
ncbi:MAG: acetoacetate--CoA ligase [Planctomycetes bacterium]|nr:acetoacetate--CoA ligase [Planctomycetota bacterium]